MKPHIPVAAVFCAVGLSRAPSVRAEIPDKQAEPAETSGKQAIKPVPLILSGSRGTFEIPINRATETRIIFPGDIRYSGAVRSHPRIKVDHRYGELRIHLRDAATPDDKLNVMVETANELVSLRLRVVGDDKTVDPLYEVQNDEETAAKAKWKAEIQRIEAAFDSKYNQLESKRKAEFDYLLRSTAATWSNREALRPVDHVTECDGSETDPAILYAGWHGPLFVVVFAIDNRGATPYRLARVEVRDKRGEPLTIGVVQVDGFNVDSEEVIAEIPPHTRAQGAVVVLDAGKAQLGSVRLTLDDADTPHRPHAIVTRWGDDPVPLFSLVGGDAPDDRGPVVRPAQSSRNALSFNLQAIGGVGWFKDGVTGDGRLDPAALAGVGVRVTYPFNRTLALEADVAGASSGQTRFPGVNLNGSQGDVERTARLARVLFMGAVRMGDRIAPTVRLGAGVQGTNYTSTFVSSDGTTMDLESPLDFDLIACIGAGVDARIGERLQLGVGLLFIGRAYSSERLFEAGVQLGFAHDL